MGVIRFIPAHQITDPLPISLGYSGASGSGKTVSALRTARGIAQEITGEKNAPFGFVDTENRRGLHYREAFPEMMHSDFSALNDTGQVVGFTIDRWLEMIDAAEHAQLPVVAVDSYSHSWAGVGGVLEMHQVVLDRLVAEAERRANGKYTIERDKFSMLAWAEVKPAYRRLVDRIIRSRTNFVICTRAKPVMQKGYGEKITNAFKTKTRRMDVPWNPETDSDLMFELTAMVILDPAAPGCPVHQIKMADQFKGVFDPKRPITEETGRAMAEWSKGNGNAQKQKQVMDSARDVARQGTEAFTAWWQSEAGKQARGVVRPIMDELKDLVQGADRARVDEFSDDPFSSGSGQSSDETDEATSLSLVEQIEACETKDQLVALRDRNGAFRAARAKLTGDDAKEIETALKAAQYSFERTTTPATAS